MALRSSKQPPKVSSGGGLVKYVYLLESISNPRQRYRGLTDNLVARLACHSAGEVRSTARYRPWHPVVAIQFESDTRAAAFEKYLKSGSGHAFANRHLW